jgi:thymidylate kinase
VTTQRGFTVALIGADGAGKTTIGLRLADELPVPAAYLYMGDNAEAAGRLLPTTRLVRSVRRARGTHLDGGGPPGSSVRTSQAGLVPRARRAAKSYLRLTNQLAEEWYRQGLAWLQVRRGNVVIFDRHYFADYYAHDVAANGRPLNRRLHGLLLERLYPRPDLVVFLDAPPEVLFARKREGTPALLARRRDEYLDVARATRNFVIVDANQPLEDVVREVAAIVLVFSEARWRPPRRHPEG